MTRFFTIECSTDNYFVHVHEVQQSFDEHGVVFRREVAVSAVLLGEVGDPKFFGQLNSLLFTAQTIKNAEPIKPVSADPSLTSPNA